MSVQALGREEEGARDVLVLSDTRAAYYPLLLEPLTFLCG